MARAKIPVLVAETLALRKMSATALEQQGFAAATCEPRAAEAELRRNHYRILITSSPVHVRRGQIPAIYLAAESMEFLDDMPPQIRVVAKPFGVDQLMEGRPRAADGELRNAASRRPGNGPKTGGDSAQADEARDPRLQSHAGESTDGGLLRTADGEPRGRRKPTAGERTKDWRRFSAGR